MSQIDRSEGRRLFGSDPAAYDRARPGHPDGVYEVLVDRCGLVPGARVIEVGPGTGQATRRLLDLGAKQLLAIEPDPALAAYLEAELGGRIETWIVSLEDARLPPNTFDIATAATSFHWVTEDAGLEKLFSALRPGGWLAMWWTMFGDDARPDPFRDATDSFMEGLGSSPHEGGSGKPRFPLDTQARTAALGAAGFEQCEHELIPWSSEWSTAGIRELFSTFSPIARLTAQRRAEVLDGVARVARDEFEGRVSKPLLTSLYTARRPI